MDYKKLDNDYCKNEDCPMYVAGAAHNKGCVEQCMYNKDGTIKASEDPLTLY